MDGGGLMVGRWLPRRPKPPSRPEPLSRAGSEVPPTALPEGLGSRLREIARQEMLCRDFDRLWPEHLRAELVPDEARRVALHLESCRRCATLAAVLEAAVVLEEETLAPSLAARLSALGRRLRPPLPFYVRDVRFAAAASWLLAIALAALLGGPEALAERGLTALQRPVHGAAEELGEHGGRWLDGLSSRAQAVGESFGGGWQRFGAGLGAGLRSFEAPFASAPGGGVGDFASDASPTDRTLDLDPRAPEPVIQNGGSSHEPRD